MRPLIRQHSGKFLAALVLLLMAGIQVRGEDADVSASACSSHLGSLPVALGQSLPERVNVLSWNIQKTSVEGWRSDLLRLGNEANLTFLQEAALYSQLGEIWPRGPLYQSFAAGYRTALTPTGVMTLSSHAPTMQCNFSHREPWLGTLKAVTVTEHAIQGRPDRLLAINVHAVNFTLGLEDLKTQLEPLVGLLRIHEGPVILAGDLNTWSGARAALVSAVLQDQGLQPLTFNPDLRSTAFGRPLDHIYVRGASVERAEVVVVGSSDHNPLRAVLRLDG